jgi:hypothetical protein
VGERVSKMLASLLPLGTDEASTERSEKDKDTASSDDAAPAPAADAEKAADAQLVADDERRRANVEALRNRVAVVPSFLQPSAPRDERFHNVHDVTRGQESARNRRPKLAAAVRVVQMGPRLRATSNALMGSRLRATSTRTRAPSKLTKDHVKEHVKTSTVDTQHRSKAARPRVDSGTMVSNGI